MITRHTLPSTFHDNTDHAVGQDNNNSGACPTADMKPQWRPAWSRVSALERQIARHVHYSRMQRVFHATGTCGFPPIQIQADDLLDSSEKFVVTNQFSCLDDDNPHIQELLMTPCPETWGSGFHPSISLSETQVEGNACLG